MLRALQVGGFPAAEHRWGWHAPLWPRALPGAPTYPDAHACMPQSSRAQTMDFLVCMGTAPHAPAYECIPMLVLGRALTKAPWGGLQWAVWV